MMGDYGGMGGGFGGGFMILWGVLLIVIIVVTVRWLFSSSRPGSKRSDESKALEILKERYARGEIDEQEITTRQRHLNL